MMLFINCGYGGDKEEAKRDLHKILKHILPAHVDQEKLIERCLFLVPVLKANIGDWDNFKAFVQGCIMRHGQIHPKYHLLTRVPQDATYINPKSPGGKDRAYP